jgi:hypothetical protein
MSIDRTKESSPSLITKPKSQLALPKAEEKALLPRGSAKV